MANSDNVVRAGLTPKFVDVENLAKITQYMLEPLEVNRGEANGLGGRVYPTPVDEFEVHFFETESSPTPVDLESWSGAVIGVVLNGEIKLDATYKKGQVFLIPDESALKGELSASSQVAFAKPKI